MTSIISRRCCHESLKAAGALVSPQALLPFEGTIMGLEGSLPFVSGCNLNKMVGVPKVDLGIDSCFSCASKRSEMSGSGYRSFREIRLRPRKSTQSRESHLLPDEQTGAHGRSERMDEPCSKVLVNDLRRAASSSWTRSVPSSRVILRS